MVRNTSALIDTFSTESCLVISEVIEVVYFQNANLGEKIGTLENGVKALQEELTRERSKFQQCNNELLEVRHSCSNVERDFAQSEKTLKDTQNQVFTSHSPVMFHWPNLNSVFSTRINCAFSN